jgi:cytochrome c5
MERPMRRSLAAVLVALAFPLGAAFGASLTDDDSRYLDATFGLTVRTEIVAAMKPDDQSKLHDVVNDAFAKDYPGIRYNRVADFLFRVYTQQCRDWAESHPGDACAPPAAAAAAPGKAIADRQCSSCHLFGTSTAPSFHDMANAKNVTEAWLTEALSQGHRMSPMTLAPDQVRALIAYIETLR